MFQQGGYNIRMKAMHFLNAESYTPTLIAMVKRALKRKLADKVSANYVLNPFNTTITALIQPFPFMPPFKLLLISIQCYRM